MTEFSRLAFVCAVIYTLSSQITDIDPRFVTIFPIWLVVGFLLMYLCVRIRLRQDEKNPVKKDEK